ncbi:hypothetical protein [Mucilaginibacter sp.]|uniref:HYC_CC_PP family protein n=1 Tax=Mucilaginibacter sp. TaxID=1882438 RepID=UPI00374D667F
MKRTAVILLTTIYLLSSLGVAANSFYCCGRLKSTTFFLGAEKMANCKMASNMKGCCKTKKQYYKIKDQHLCALGFNLDTKLFASISIRDFAIYVGLNNQRPQLVSYNSHGPPDRLKASVYTLNCTYRI